MKDPWLLGRDWGRWPGCPSRGAAMGMLLWWDNAGAGGSSCCVLGCQHSNDGGVKSGTRSFGWLLFVGYTSIYLVLLKIVWKWISLMHQRNIMRQQECNVPLANPQMRLYHRKPYSNCYCCGTTQPCLQRYLKLLTFYILNNHTPNKPTSMSEHWSPLQTLHHHHHHQRLGSLSLPHSRSHGNFTAFQWAAWFTSQHWPLWG